MLKLTVHHLRWHLHSIDSDCKVRISVAIFGLHYLKIRRHYSLQVICFSIMHYDLRHRLSRYGIAETSAIYRSYTYRQFIRQLQEQTVHELVSIAPALVYLHTGVATCKSLQRYSKSCPNFGAFLLVGATTSYIYST